MIWSPPRRVHLTFLSNMLDGGVYDNLTPIGINLTRSWLELLVDGELRLVAFRKQRRKLSRRYTKEFHNIKVNRD